LRLYAVPDRPAQLMVSLHEHLHHELQWSTAWGLVAAMAGLLAGAGIEPDRLRDVAAVANSACRRVHEVFATTISCGVIGIPGGRRMLAGNDRYLSYLDEGLRLGGDPSRWPWQFRESAMQMLLRSLMQPAPLAEIAERGFERITFGALLAEFPDRGGDRGDAWARTLPDDGESMDRLKMWEESVLIPRLQAVAGARLAGHGLTILDEGSYLESVDALRRSFVALGPEDWQVEVLTGHRRMSDEPLGAERESVVLHPAPADVVVITQEDLSARSRAFLFEPDSAVAHVLALYLPRPVLLRQFRGFGGLNAGGPPVLALAGRPMLTEGGGRAVPVALMRAGLRPRQLTEMFSRVPVVVLTCLTATREKANQDIVTELEAVYVLVDLPLNLQVTAWITDGWTVRFRVIDLHGERPLNLIVFALDELPGCWFLDYRGDAGFGELAQLLDRNPGRLASGLTLAESTLAAITSITSWLLAAWWRFEEAEPD
jgi:hypothetical protein